MKNIVRIILFCFFIIPEFIQAQQYFSDSKQTNETGSDILADAPWRMKLTDSSGNLQGIPVHIFIKDADVIGNNAELIYLDIYVKNASDTNFSSPIVFNTYTSSAFQAMFSSKSQTDPILNIQSFDASLPVSDSAHSIMFTSNNCVWPDNCTYVDITHAFWYFTITLPPEKLAGFEDIVDIKVYFSLNWQTDVESDVRVFRYDENQPSLPGWYRGDTHYHSMYTNNTAEFGLPLSADKEAAKAIGLDWITITDHSCDYDNYGLSIQDNWSRQDSEIEALNAQDTSMFLIHGIEVSVNNSAANLVHLLCYPPGSDPYAMSYLGDGNGDVSSTSLYIDQILYPLAEVDGFAYAAHPFAGGDKLSSLVDGGIWNVGDTTFYANGTPIAGHDNVICNDPAYPSDLYSQNSGQLLFKKEIRGGQIWNFRNSLTTTDEMMNPWNVNYDSGVTAFVPYDSSITMQHYNRFLQGMEVTKFFNKKGLIMKNANTSLNDYRFYFTAGSDAHGSFNFSNTDFVQGLVADIHDNAMGRPSSLVYCLAGMGNAGGNVLNALKNGNIILSDGPLVSIGLSTDGINNTSEYIVGQEALPNGYDYLQTKLRIDLATTNEYGNFNECQIIIGTSHGEYPLILAMDTTLHNETLFYNLDSLISQITNDSIQEEEYFYLRAKLSCIKWYGQQAVLYKKPKEIFHSFTNPIWIKKPAIIVSASDIIQDENNISAFPNPFNSLIGFAGNLPEETSITVSVFNLLGQIASKKCFGNFHAGEFNISYKTDFLEPGLYLIELSEGSTRHWFRAIKAAEN